MIENNRFLQQQQKLVAGMVVPPRSQLYVSANSDISKKLINRQHCKKVRTGYCQRKKYGRITNGFLRSSPEEMCHLSRVSGLGEQPILLQILDTLVGQKKYDQI
jgi:hypothetical protein